MKNLKVGYRFRPEDEQLIGYYLYRRIKEALSPEERSFIGDCDMYGDEEPNQIWDKLGDQEEEEEGIFVFTKLKRAKKEDGSIGIRFERKVGTHGGTWHGEDTASNIHVTIRSSTPDHGSSHKKRLVGKKKRFIYKHEGSEQHGVWILQEYTLENYSDWALCRLKKSPHAAKKSANKRPASSCLTMENHAKKRKEMMSVSSDDQKVLPAQEPVEPVVVYPPEQQNQQQRMIMQQPMSNNESFFLPQLVEEDENNAVATSYAEMIYPSDESTTYDQQMQHGFGYGNINPPHDQFTSYQHEFGYENIYSLINRHSRGDVYSTEVETLATTVEVALLNVCSVDEPENQLMMQQQQQSMCITESLIPSWLVEEDRDNIGGIATPTCLDDSTSDQQIQHVNEEDFSTYNEKIQQPMHEVICVDDSTSEEKIQQSMHQVTCLDDSITSDEQIQQPMREVTCLDDSTSDEQIQTEDEVDFLSYEQPWTVEELLEQIQQPMYDVICLDDSSDDEQIQTEVEVDFLSYEQPWNVEELLEEANKVFSTDDSCNGYTGKAVPLSS